MSLIDDILDNIDIVDIIGRYINLKRVGRNYVALCPFHREKTPSFVVSPEKQIFKCFWCWIGGNAIKFIMEYEKVDFRDAIKILAKEAWIDISKYKKFETKEEKKWSEKEKYLTINKYALKFFKEELRKSPEAIKYLKEERHLTDNIIEQFQLWYAPDSFSKLIDYLLNKWFEAEDIIKIGLWKQNNTNLFSFFKKRIIFPIYDHIWNLVAFAWRVIDPNDSPKYLNTPETPIYDKSKVLYWLNIAKNYYREFENKIFIVEWYMDVIALARWWIPIWVATCWTALTPNHVKLLKRYTENIIFSFDNDDAWLNATIRWLKICFENEIYPKNFLLPAKFKDFDEAINNLWKDEFKNLILDKNNYKDSFLFITEKLIHKYNINEPLERKQFFNILFDTLINLKDYSILQFYLQKLWEITNTDPQILFKQFKTFIRKNKFNKTLNEDNQSNTKQLDTNRLLASLIYQDFRLNLLTDNLKLKKNVEEFIELIIAISPLLEWNILKKITEDNLDSNEIEKLKEYQLRWEQQKEIDKILTKFILSETQRIIKILIKLNELDEEEKIEFINQFKNISRQFLLEH